VFLFVFRSEGEKSKGGPVTSVSVIAERAGILVTELKKADFSSKDVVQDLTRLIRFAKGSQQDAAVLPETKKSAAMCSVGALVKFLKLTNDESNFSSYKLLPLDSSSWMRLDAAAVKV
jgi:DNA mismatch repair protein MSH2